jgi:folate-binding Fe-S cluster repair protein YgfZ
VVSVERLTLEQAHLALEAGPVVVPRPGRGLVRLAGPPRIWFLQNTITNDVEDVPPGRWVESCFLDLKGKVLAHFRAGVLEDEVLLDVDPPGTEPLVDWFVRYRFRTKVEIEDLSGRLTCFTVLGGSSSDGEVRRRGDGAAFGGRLGEVSTLDVYAPGLPAGLPLAPEELYHVLRVEAGAGRFGVD